MARPRPDLLEVSAVIALVAASMPPMPRPVMNRQIVRVQRSFELWAMYMPTAMITRQTSMASLRPPLSAKPPRITDPKPMPTSSAESLMPSSSRGIPHSWEMPGAAKALDSTSNPSSALSSTISATTIHCRTLIGLSSITLIGLVPPAGPAIATILSLCAPSFVDSRQHFHQFFGFLAREARLQPCFVLGDAGLRLDERRRAGFGQIERLLAPVARRTLAAHVAPLLHAVDDRHRRRPVHPQAAAELDLRDAGHLADQPQRRHLLLGQVERGERLAEMAVDRAMGEADVEADDLCQPPD